MQCMFLLGIAGEREVPVQQNGPREQGREEFCATAQNELLANSHPRNKFCKSSRKGTFAFWSGND